MADNWFREIELQKVFSLSPGEAQCTVASKNGLKTSEIAELADISENTVRTLLNRGANKMKKAQKTVDVAVVKGDQMVEGTMVKQNAIMVLFKFAEKALGAQFNQGNSVFLLRGLDAKSPGDTQFMNNEVFRMADIYGTASEDAANARADKILSIQNAKKGDSEPFGWAVIRYYLDQMYMKYDIIE